MEIDEVVIKLKWDVLVIPVSLKMDAKGYIPWNKHAGMLFFCLLWLCNSLLDDSCDWFIYTYSGVLLWYWGSYMIIIIPMIKSC